MGYCDLEDEDGCSWEWDPGQEMITCGEIMKNL